MKTSKAMTSLFYMTWTPPVSKAISFRSSSKSIKANSNQLKDQLIFCLWSLTFWSWSLKLKVAQTDKWIGTLSFCFLLTYNRLSRMLECKLTKPAPQSKYSPACWVNHRKNSHFIIFFTLMMRYWTSTKKGRSANTQVSFSMPHKSLRRY